MKAVLLSRSGGYDPAVGRETYDPTLDGFVEVGKFRDFSTWVNKAKSWIGGTGAVCVDARGRRCAIGRDFMRARDDGSFPVTYYVKPPRKKRPR